MKKRLWIPIIFLIVMLCVPVMAEDESVWTFDVNDYTLDGYTGTGTDVVVPDTIQGCPVETIGTGAFGSCAGITSLTFPETVTLLEGSVGSGCESLASISLPQSLMVIGDGCFASEPALEQVTIPSKVCYIGSNTFYFCSNLKSITFEGECPVIGLWAFTEISPDAVVYVPDDQLEAYTSALQNAGCTAAVQPSGQNAKAAEPVSDLENLVFDAAAGTITGYTGYSTRLDIPETIDGVPVTAVGDNAFQGHRYLCYLTLPEGLTSIGNEAFMDATTLLHVEFPSTLKNIGDRAFCRSYRGKTMELPEGLESIGAEAFVYAAVEGALHLPEGLKTIGDSAFLQCWIRELYVPSTVEKIGSRAFADSGSLSYLAFDFHEMIDLASDAFSGCPAADLDLPWDSSVENQEAYKLVMAEQCPDCTVWINNPITGGVAEYPDNSDPGFSMAENVWTSYSGDTPNLTIWTDYDGYNVTALGDGLFKGSQTIRSFYPHHCGWFTTIGNEAFADSTLEYMEMFGSITTIGDGAFRNCANLKEMTLPSSVTSIGAGAFQNCASIKELTIPASVTAIGAGAFEGCQGLEKVTILCDASLVGEGAFAGCSNLTEVSVAKGAIPANCFADSIVTTLTLGEEVAAVGDGAFANSKLEKIEIPGSISTIGAGAFQNCTNITELSIPASVTSIGAGAFEGCQGLEKVTILCDASLLGEGAFAGCANLTEAAVVKGAIPANCFADSAVTTVTLGEEVTAAGDRAFAGTTIGALVIPANMEINVAAFEGLSTEGFRMSDLASDEQLAAWNEALNTPWYCPMVRKSEKSSFEKMPFVPSPEEDFEFDEMTGTIGLYLGNDVDVVIPRSIGGVAVKRIGMNVFDRAEDYTNTEVETDQTEWLHLRSVVIPETVTEIEDSAFEYCQQLETLVCYGPLDTAGRGTFMKCRSLKDVVFVNGVKKMDNYLFLGCESLKNVWYKGQLDYVGEDTFRGCAVESLVINAKEIFGTAFRECTSLKEIHLRGGVEALCKGAFMECTSLDTICFEFSNPGVLDDGDVYSGECGPDAKLILPASTTDEEAAQFYNILKKGNLGPIADESHVVREECTTPDPEEPDVKELMAAYDMVYDDGMAEEAPASEVKPEETPEAEATETSSPATEAPAAEAGQSAGTSEEVLGSWNGVTMIAEGMEMNLADFGMIMQLTINADGTGTWDEGEGAETISWTSENGTVSIDGKVLSITSDGKLCMEEDGAQILFERADDAASAAAGESPAAEPAEEPPVSEPAENEGVETPEDGAKMSTSDGQTGTAVDQSSYLERKYICKSVDANGYNMDASTLGAEYSVIFHANGSMDFVLAGTNVPGLEWTQGKVQTEVGEADAFSTVYLDGTTLNFAITEAGFDLDFYGSMLMHFEPEA